MKNLIQSILATFGYEIRRSRGQRGSMEGALGQLKKMGLRPKHIIDIGAAFGDWTMTAKEFFPEATYTLVEPLKEYIPSLKKVPNAQFQTSAVSDKDGDITLHVHKDWAGSSIYEEQEAREDIVLEDRTVPSVSLSTLTKGLSGSLFIKIDAQGAELLILRNSNVFDKTEAFILECSLFHSIKSAPLIDTICNFMREKGFVVYDIIDPSYRLLDNALSQVNIVFVKKTGELRKNQAYADKSQRQKQNDRMIKRNLSRLS